MTPTMGLNALLMGAVAAIIGGIGSIPGAAIGALILAFAQQFGVWKIPTQWQDAIAFAVLLVFLVMRPWGVFGRKARRVRV
jgi:branched-subunit amino acid ABC-type transport system permease component